MTDKLHILSFLLFIHLLALNFQMVGQPSSAAQTAPNIVFIAIDDMNDWAGFMQTHPQVQTPNMDKLAAQGISFKHAHCPAPICGPSRTAIMSGLWPTSNGIYTNAINYRKQLPHLISLPEHFREHGYRTLGVGKIFHSGTSKMPEGAFDLYGGKGGSAAPFSSTELALQKQIPFHEVEKDGKKFRLPLNGIPADRHWGNGHTFDWGAVDVADSLFADVQSTAWAITQLQKEHTKPFFLAVGFSRPHQPLFNPKRFHDLYPVSSVVLPQVIQHDLSDVPRAGIERARAATSSGLHKSVVQYGQWAHAVSSYLASISFVDELVGKIVEAVQNSPHADHTLIVLWSDHGWHLGEKEHWGKGTGWLRSTRVPLIIVPSKHADIVAFQPGNCERVVNLLDLPPTLAEMAHIPIRAEWEGKSLVPLIKNPEAKWQAHTHTTFGRGNHAVSTDRWRYIQYFDGSAELYDIQRDPAEFTNLIHDSSYRSIISQLRTHVPTEPQWRYFVRYHNFKAVIPADGKPMHLYNLAYQNQANEQTDVAQAYPHIVKKIADWLKREQPKEKYLDLTAIL